MAKKTAICSDAIIVKRRLCSGISQTFIELVDIGITVFNKGRTARVTPSSVSAENDFLGHIHMPK